VPTRDFDPAVMALFPNVMAGAAPTAAR